MALAYMGIKDDAVVGFVPTTTTSAYWTSSRSNGAYIEQASALPPRPEIAKAIAEVNNETAYELHCCDRP